MKTTGIFTILKYDIHFKKYGDPIEIIPFGDVHRDSPLCHAEKWGEFCEWASRRKNAYFLGMGDYMDGCSTSERGAFDFNALHDATHQNLDKSAKDKIKAFSKEIRFMKGRCIGILNGNHYWQFRNGTTTDHMLADLLDTNFLGVSAFFKISFRRDQHHCNTLDVWAHHGAGGGATPGASINRLDKMRLGATADIYLMGHNHKKQVVKESCLRLSDARRSLSLENRTIILGRTGSFLKGYEPGASSYIADGAHGPCDLGVIKIIVTPKVIKESKRNREKRWLEVEGML